MTATTTEVPTERLIFGQPHAASAAWFARHVDPGGSTLPVARFPHRLALDAQPQAYLDYLAASWAPKNPTEADFGNRIARFYRLAESIERDGVRVPIRCVERPDGRLIVTHGNHRASICDHLGRPVPVEIVDPVEWARETVANRARYGTGRTGEPYQDVPGLLGGRRVVDGRHRAIHPDDLNGTVLDLGCNLGAATRAAALTAEVAYGVDVDPKLVTAALRLGVWFDSPARFGVCDLAHATPRPPGQGWSTILCFAVAAHVPSKPLWTTLRTGRVVYVEANQRGGQTSGRPPVLDWFSTVEVVATEPRTMWRCVP